MKGEEVSPAVPEETFIERYGRASYTISITAGFLTLRRAKNMLYLPTPASHSLHGVADGNTNCAHGTVISRV